MCAEAVATFSSVTGSGWCWCRHSLLCCCHCCLGTHAYTFRPQHTLAPYWNTHTHQPLHQPTQAVSTRRGCRPRRVRHLRRASRNGFVRVPWGAPRHIQCHAVGGQVSCCCCGCGGGVGVTRVWRRVCARLLKQTHHHTLGFPHSIRLDVIPHHCCHWWFGVAVAFIFRSYLMRLGKDSYIDAANMPHVLVRTSTTRMVVTLFTLHGLLTRFHGARVRGWNHTH